MFLASFVLSMEQQVFPIGIFYYCLKLSLLWTAADVGLEFLLNF